MKGISLKGFVFPFVFVFVLVFVWAVPAHADETATKKVNINSASVKELQTLPQIGVAVAQRIVDFREKHGKFSKIEEIMKVKGIGEKTFLKLKPLITVGQESKTKKEQKENGGL